MRKGIWGTLLLLVLATALLVVFLQPGNQQTKTASRGQTQLGILMYHQIVEENQACPDAYTLSVSILQKDLWFLQAEGYQPVTLSQVLAYGERGDALPEKPVLLVFDDGYTSALTLVLPVLRANTVPAVFSVIGACAEYASRYPSPYLSWEELGILQSSGFAELQSHTAYGHRYGERRGLSRLWWESDAEYAAFVERDAGIFKLLTEKSGLSFLPSLAYPYGIYSGFLDSRMRAAGFLCTMTSEEHTNWLYAADPSSLFQLGRLNRSASLETSDILRYLTATPLQRRAVP